MKQDKKSETQKFRDCVADLILKDYSGADLVICSPLKSVNGGSEFIVGENKEAGDRYRVRVEIEEI